MRHARRAISPRAFGLPDSGVLREQQLGAQRVRVRLRDVDVDELADQAIAQGLGGAGGEVDLSLIHI